MGRRGPISNKNKELLDSLKPSKVNTASQVSKLRRIRIELHEILAVVESALQRIDGDSGDVNPA